MKNFSNLSDFGFLIIEIILKESLLEGNDIVSTKKICEKSGISNHTCAKVLKLLKKGKVLGATEGKNGGYYLIDKNNVSFLDVLEAVDGAYENKKCGTSYCSKSNSCKFKHVLNSANAASRKILSENKFIEVING